MATPMAGKRPKTLFVFDFDHTLVDGNTDTWVMEARPALGLLEGLQETRKRLSCWPDLMDWALGAIHGAGCGREELLEHMRRLRLHDEALKAVRAVREVVGEGEVGGEAIIISDSNTVFIDAILRECSVEDVFCEVFANPAHFDPSGRLRVAHCHAHSCPRCAGTPNMCKRAILSGYLSKRGGFERVVYVGDGRNDVCPCLSLTERDHAVCREDFTLATRLGGVADLKATCHVVNFERQLGDFMSREFLDV